MKLPSKNHYVSQNIPRLEFLMDLSLERNYHWYNSRASLELGQNRKDPGYSSSPRLLIREVSQLKGLETVQPLAWAAVLGDKTLKPSPAYSVKCPTPGLINSHDCPFCHHISWQLGLPANVFLRWPGRKHLQGGKHILSIPCQLHIWVITKRFTHTYLPKNVFVPVSLADVGIHLHVCDITLKNSQLLRSSHEWYAVGFSPGHGLITHAKQW